MSSKISIIVPIYNMEKYLRRCIDSILEQTYNDLEIILVNDGSIDDSAIICEEYKSRDSRIKLINKINGGLSSARNQGLDNATGDYISFIDPDDYLSDRNMYRELIEIIKRESADMVMCNLFMSTDTKNVYVDLVEDYRVIDLNISTDKRWFAEYLYYKYKFSAYVFTKLYKRHIFENIRFPLKRRCEDGFVIMPIIANTKKIVLQPKAYYNYYQREDGLNRSNHDEKWEIDFLESRVLQAIEYNEWCKEIDSGTREYFLYRIYRNLLFFILDGQRLEYMYCIPYLKGKLKELLNSNLSFRHKVSIYKVLVKLKMLSISK